MLGSFTVERWLFYSRSDYVVGNRTKPVEATNYLMQIRPYVIATTKSDGDTYTAQRKE